jgi:hypothetical protein
VNFHYDYRGIHAFTVRRALTDAPENVATLIQVVCRRLFNLISDHTFPSPSNTSVTAYATSFIKNASSTPDRNPTKEVLNCLRVLERVLPVVFELQGESNTFELELLWKKEEIAEHEEMPSIARFVIEDEDEGGQDLEGSQNSSTSSRPSAEKTKKQQLPSLVERLFNAITDLLFCCGFTLPKTLQVDHHKINYIIWCVPINSAWFHELSCNLGRRVLGRLHPWAIIQRIMIATKQKSCD